MMIAPWDVLPHLAWEVRVSFESYVTTGWVSRERSLSSSPLTLSAGLFAEADKFPVYRAADLAKESLSSSKRYGTLQEKRGELEFVLLKDSVTWLDHTFDWKSFRFAFDLSLKLAKVVSRENGQKAPQSLLWLLHEAGYEYKQNAKLFMPGERVYGSWMWRLAYGFTRLIDRLKKDSDLAVEVSGIIGECYDLSNPENMADQPIFEFIGVPVRWAELLTRKESGHAA